MSRPRVLTQAASDVCIALLVCTAAWLTHCRGLGQMSASTVHSGAGSKYRAIQHGSGYRLTVRYSLDRVKAQLRQVAFLKPDEKEVCSGHKGVACALRTMTRPSAATLPITMPAMPPPLLRPLLPPLLAAGGAGADTLRKASALIICSQYALLDQLHWRRQSDETMLTESSQSCSRVCLRLELRSGAESAPWYPHYAFLEPRPRADQMSS